MRSDAWARWLFDHPRTIAVGLALAALASIAMLPRLEIAAGLEPYFQPDSPNRKLLQRTNETFASDNLVYVAYRTDDPFSHSRLTELRQLASRIKAIDLPGQDREEPVIEEVLSLATVKDLVGTQQLFRAAPLIPDPVPRSRMTLQQVRRRALANPLIRSGLLGTDAKVAALTVRLGSSLSDEQTAKLVKTIRQVVAAQQRQVPQTRYFISGQAVIDADMASYQVRDLRRAIPLCYALVFLIMFVFVRRLLSLLVAGAALTLSLVLSMAILGAIGGTVNNASVMIPPVVVSLSVAALLHFLSELSKHDAKRGGVPARQRTVAGLLAPQSMAALTTAIGFASLALAHPPAIKQFGLGAAASALVIFIVTTGVFVLASRRWATVRLISPRGAAHSTTLARLLSSISRLVVARPGTVVLVGLAMTIVVALGAARLRVDQREIEYFSQDAPVRIANGFIEKHLAGTSTLVISIRADTVDRFVQPTQLKRLERLHRFLTAEIGAKQVNSVLDLVKLAHREFWGGRPAAYKIPESSEQAAQLLMLTGDPRMGEFINDHRDWARVVVRLATSSSFDLMARVRRTEAELERLFPPREGFVPAVTGRSRLTADMVTGLVTSQTRSLTASFLLIFVVMIVLFRSLPCALIAFVPNALPVAANFGLMGWLGLDLDAATVMIATVSLGIAVDDTVHFLRQYQVEMRRRADAAAAVTATMATKGPAIIWTSVVIGLGFCVLLTSSFMPTRRFGLLVCIAMAVALLADLLLLPALLLKAQQFARWSTSVRSRHRGRQQQARELAHDQR